MMMMAWRLIETAPKDGERVLIWCERIDVCIGWFQDEEQDVPDQPGHAAGWWSETGQTHPAFPSLDIDAEYQPTYWAPILRAPVCIECAEPLPDGAETLCRVCEDLTGRATHQAEAIRLGRGRA